ncbi:hypothetical protein VMUT_0814 [Vulcanisaeta moutnovskia 768-28]|uniref:DUF1616 domain-containing protein n=1 Tax=Vulcanisaeta moutnovskia (strain 768-28) TaxID=985053 RepID=F0QWH6_VULM7|nr:hypothetical protein [Vulcanisaeta moutnovskia]ADY01024.1 hypothetical protein VMUT_0814 [Vulcanisaeta moutnovskia 768-28]
MLKGRWMWLALVLTALLLVIVDVSSYSQQNTVLIAYRDISYLGANGVNVTKDVSLLNNAIVLMESGNYTGAQSLANEVIKDTQSLRGSFYVSIIYMVLPGIISIIVIITLIVMYLMRERIIGKLIIKFRSHYKVIKGSGKSRTMLFNEEVLAVVAAIIVVFLVFFSFYPAINRYAIEPYAAIAFLGPNGTITQYPSIVYPDEPINVSVYVYNGMGRPIWFVVYVYVTNTSFIEPPLNATPIMTLQRILLNNESWVQGITLSINKTGNYRVFATLWMYDPNNLELKYLNTYVYLTLNATSQSFP